MELNGAGLEKKGMWEVVAVDFVIKSGIQRVIV